MSKRIRLKIPQENPDYSEQSAYVIERIARITCKVANVLERNWIGIDINQDYVEMSRTRIAEKALSFDSYDPRVERTPRDLPRTISSAQITLL